MSTKINIKECAAFGMLGAVMFITKILMQFLPNIHLLGTLIVAITVVYRVKALFPLYIYILLDGVFGGFSPWWLPYLYVWTVLWGAVMLLPRRMPPKIAPIVYCVVSGLHGVLFGTLYAPVQALMFGLNFRATVAWIVAGLPFDLIHGLSNVLCGILICPLIAILRRCKKLTD